MVQHSVHAKSGDSAVNTSVEYLAAHERTYGGFTVGATGAGAHVAILLSSLALAFLGNAPVMAMLWFIVAHIGLIVMLIRLAHAERRDIGHASPVVVPVRK